MYDYHSLLYGVRVSAGVFMKAIKICPVNDRTNGWSQLLPARTPNAPLQKDIKADWVVVGAGLAGLAAARRLAENCPDDTIVLLEADEVGEGAQGRNSGFAIDIPHNVGSSMDEIAQGQRHLRLARYAIESLQEQVEKHHIECDWDQAGKFHAAVSAKGVEQILRPTLAMLQSLKEPNEWLEGAALHEKIGFDHFRAAIYTPGTVLLNPAALTRGLAAHLPQNVHLFEHTPVIRWGAEQSTGTHPIVLRTPNGQVQARKMVLTVNVFAGQFGFYKQQIIPLAAHASLTRPLTPAEQEKLPGLSSWGLTPANAFVGITMRRTADQRILIRQNIRYEPKLHASDEERARARKEHQKLFDERFPSLSGVTMEHTWTGFICVSQNGAPGFGQVASNVYSAVCQNGVGLTKGTVGGLLIADLATGRENALVGDMLALGEPTQLPPRPFLDWGVRARFAWELWSARAEA